jgi:serine/threonine protein kinase
MKTFVGTWGFTAPEMFLSNRRFKRSVDIYSLGVIFYMLLQTKSKLEDNKCLINESYKYSIEDFNSFHDQEMKQLALRMLEHDPKKRPKIKDVIKSLKYLKLQITTTKPH